MAGIERAFGYPFSHERHHPHASRYRVHIGVAGRPVRGRRIFLAGERMSTVKRRSPETVGQAREWDRTKGRYLLFGLCELCAGQAAYGHQQHAGGWDAINPPCPKCAEVVAAMPIATGNPQWRKTGRFDAS